LLSPEGDESSPMGRWSICAPASPEVLTIIPKKNGTVRFISDFRKLNEMLKRMPYPIPKNAQMLQELEKSAYATSLDLNMGFYTIKLDSDAEKS
jgi:hypothetical protein